MDFGIRLYARVFKSSADIHHEFRYIVEAALQVAPRPRKGIIPPGLLAGTEHQSHFGL